nr:reverse transcriptase domain-containing protein [Tanacetum cinerariifolium]
MHEKKPDLSFLYVFGLLCYPTNDSEDLGKLKLKADIVLVADTPRHVDPTNSPMSTSVDQDTPSTSIPSSQEQSPVIFQGVERSPKTPHFLDDPLHETLHEDSTSQGSSSYVRPSHTPLDILEKTVHKELGDSLVRASTTAFSLEADQDSDPFTELYAQPYSFSCLIRQDSSYDVLEGVEGVFVVAAKVLKWVKWRENGHGTSRSYLANRTNNAASKNKGCGAFDLHMDELCGGKITISVQQDHRKARCEENPVSPINSSRNAKIPGSRRKNQGGNSPRVPRVNNCNRMLTSQTKEKKSSIRMKQSNTRGGGKTGRRRHNERSPLSQLVVKPRGHVPGLQGKQGIKVCPNKVEAVLSLPSLKCLKDVQKLNGKLKSDFQWIVEAEVAFKQMKKLIAELPTLTAPMEREELILYLAAAREAAYTIIVITDQPIKQVPSRPEVVGRLKKWSIELGEYDIKYRPRTSFNGQIFANFIVERLEDDPPDMPMEAKEELPNPLTLFKDGSSRIDSFGAGLILTNPEGAEFTYTLRFKFDATNNEAEYEALIAGLRIAKQIGVKNLQTNMNSRLVANQHFSFVKHLEANGIVERANRSLGERKKAQLDERSKDWIEETPHVLWAHCTMIKSSNEDTPFSLTYKTKAVIPVEIEFTYTLRFKFDATNNEAEYEALIAGLRIAKQIGVKNLQTNMNSRLVANQHFSFVKHLEANGIVERANRSLGERKKAQLDERSKDWIEETPHVLWAHCTMIKSSNEDTPFSLTYKTKAVIPVEIGMPTLKIAEIDMVQNDEAVEINLDLLEERREQAAIHEARNKAKMEKYYNSKVRNTSFKTRDLVYQNNEASHVKYSRKLNPKWEGPYEVTKALGMGAYKLRDRNGNLLP